MSELLDKQHDHVHMVDVKRKKEMRNYDDKELAIVCILLLGVGAMFIFKESIAVVGAITAIAALATGKK